MKKAHRHRSSTRKATNALRYEFLYPAMVAMDVVKHPIQTAMQQWKSRRRGHFAVVCGLVRIHVSARGICLIVSYTPVEQVTNQLLCKDAHFLPLQCYCIDLTCDPKEATNTLSRLSTTNTLSRLSTTDTLPHLIITTIVSYSHR